MKQFRFRLQTVLEHRERHEQNAIQTYAQAQQTVADAKSTLDDLHTLKAQLIDGLTSLRLSGAIDAHEQVTYQEYIRQVRVDIARQEIIVEEMVAVAEHFRQALVDASQEKRAVDKLRERKLEAHVTESKRVEQIEADEIATTRHQFQNRAA